MEFTTRRSAAILVIALVSIVVTQIIYTLLSNAGADINRPVIWGVEAMLFLLIAVFGLVMAARTPSGAAIWAAIAAGGLLNVIQLGMGLAMFSPLQDGGEAIAPVFSAVLGMAFFLYFAGKTLFGFAAILLGLRQLSAGGSLNKIVGGLAALAGLAALIVNGLAMAMGMDLVFPAGATGTVATLLLAIAIALYSDPHPRGAARVNAG